MKDVTLSKCIFACLVASTLLLHSGSAAGQILAPTKDGQKTFAVFAGTLFVSRGLIEFESHDKNPADAEKDSWSASCEQVIRWKASGSRDVEVWVKRGDKEFHSRPIRAESKEAQNQIVGAIEGACGKSQ